MYEVPVEIDDEHLSLVKRKATTNSTLSVSFLSYVSKQMETLPHTHLVELIRRWFVSQRNRNFNGFSNLGNLKRYI